MRYLKKLWAKLVHVFKQGLTPKQLALSITISILISVFPIYGVATIILAFLAFPLKLNLPIMIIVSYIVEPLKLLLIIPFINIGRSIFGVEQSPLTFDVIKASYKADFFNTIKLLSFELLCGFAGWFIIAIPACFLLYFLLKILIQFIVNLKNKKPTSGAI